MQEPYKQTSYFASPVTIAAGVGMFVSAVAGLSAAFWKATWYTKLLSTKLHSHIRNGLESGCDSQPQHHN